MAATHPVLFTVLAFPVVVVGCACAAALFASLLGISITWNRRS